MRSAEVVNGRSFASARVSIRITATRDGPCPGRAATGQDVLEGGCTDRRVSAGFQRSRSAGLPVLAASSGRKAANAWAAEA